MRFPPELSLLRVAGAAMSSPAEWYNSLPPVTKLYGSSVFLTTCAVQLGLTSGRRLVLYWPVVTQQLQARRRDARDAPRQRQLVLTSNGRSARGQLWRLLTCFTYVGGFSMNFVVQLLWMCAACLPAQRALASDAASRCHAASATACSWRASTSAQRAPRTTPGCCSSAQLRCSRPRCWSTPLC